MKTSYLLMTALVLAVEAAGQSSTEMIAREVSFEKKGSHNALLIFNINGNIKVEGYAGDKILIEVEKTVKGKTDARVEKGKQEIQLGVIDRADTIILYVQGLCSEFGRVNKKRKNENWQKKYNGWGYNWNEYRGSGGDCDKDKQYDYKMNFTIKVPMVLAVLASTVNEGDIEMTNINGFIQADNVNGSIRLKNISGATRASTINGSVDIDYSGNPSGDSRYYSLNGDINANFKKGLAAQLTFKSFNGDFYSSVNEITPMAVTVEKYEKGEGIRYKVNGNRYKVRQGGPLLDFETFNGDVYLREVEK